MHSLREYKLLLLIKKTCDFYDYLYSIYYNKSLIELRDVEREMDNVFY